MKTYRVVQDCVHMPFKRGRFRKDDIIELDDHIIPGSCFELIDGPVHQKEQNNQGTSYSEMLEAQKAATNPTSGFAANINDVEPAIKQRGRKRKTPG